MRYLYILLAAAALTPAARSADHFPLQPGSTWEYRAEGIEEPLTIRVLSNQLHVGDGRVYSRLAGYVHRPIWVRTQEDGNLYYLEEESGRDMLLTRFQSDSSGWFEAPLRVCPQEGRAHIGREPYNGPTGPLAEVVAVEYRTSGCADAGVEVEQFAANIGMVSRTVSTIAGPRVYQLVYADTGSVQLAPHSATTLRLALERNDDRSITARLRFSGEADAAQTLVYASSQEFDMVLRNSNGEVLWQWSNGQVFNPALHERQASNLAYEVRVPADALNLPGGDYTLEAWLTTIDAQRAPRISANIYVQPAEGAESAFLPLRSRIKR